MDNLAGKLNQILNDPGSLKQIMDMASALGFSAPQDIPDTPDPNLTAQVTNAIQHAQEKEQKQQALIHALLLYLRPGRQRRLQRAMQVAQISQLAGAALQSNENWQQQEGNGHV